MGKVHKPRAGTMQFWPRVRASRAYAKVRHWFNNSDQTILGFAGYKAGMTHIQYPKTVKNKTFNVNIPVTIIECPPLKPLSLRFYIKTPYGSRVVSQLFSKNLDKSLSKKITMPKKTKDSMPENFDEIRLAVYTQPKLTGIGKKKPEIFEIGIKNELEFAKSLLEKDSIPVSEVLKVGQVIDVRGITKGKGFQGTVKRFGISLKSHKSEKKRRSVGNLGPFTPRKVDWRVPQTGQLGFHQRTEFNKTILKLGSDPQEVNQKGGIKHYGLVKNDYVLVKGSVPGPSKRLIMLTSSARGTKDKQPLEINFISTENKQ